MKSIGIIGCGWLGEPLAFEFLSLGFKVMGTVTSTEKCIQLRNSGIETYVFMDELELPKKLCQANIIVCTIPPSKTKDYKKLMCRILEQIPPSTPFIFTSSIGIYLPGKLITESSEIIKEGPLYDAENCIQHLSDNYCILRLAGLIGGDRHPVHYLQGKTLQNYADPVNLVHRNDVINAILEMSLHFPSKRIFNLCYPSHPEKFDYYHKKALELGLDPPIKGQNNMGTYKCVSGDLIAEKLKFTYEHSI